MSGKNKSFLFFVVLGLVVIFAPSVQCTTADEAFEKAVKQGTIEGYKDFLRCYSEDPLALEARQAIEDIVIGQIRNKGIQARFIIEEISSKVISGNVVMPIKNGITMGPPEDGNYATGMTVSSVTQKPGLRKASSSPRFWGDDPVYCEVVWETVLQWETGLPPVSVPKAILTGKPGEKGWRGSTVTIAGIDGPSSKADLWLLEADYPKDYILLQQIAMIPEVDGTVLRFKGEVRFRGYVFKGEENDSLSFLFHKDGFVYLHGKGEVILKDGTTVTLPLSK